MNLVEAVVEIVDGRVVLQLGPDRLELDGGYLARHPAVADYDGATLACGIRPEDLEDATIDTEAPAGRRLTVEVELVEELGSDVVVHAPIRARQVVTDELREIEADATGRELSAQFAGPAAVMRSGRPLLGQEQEHRRQHGPPHHRHIAGASLRPRRRTGHPMTTRTAILGYGFIAGLHVEAANLLSGQIELVGVAGHDAARCADFARKWDIAVATTDWHALCAQPDVDLVIVATPNSLHSEQTLHALTQGKHVLVEKPMATSTAAAEDMIEAAEANGLVLAVGHMWRYHPDVIALRDRIARGDLGQVVRTHGWGVHAGWGPSGWFTDPELAGGGALIDMGIHAIDTARFLLGDPEPVRVSASIGTGRPGSYDVDDDGLVIIDWSNDVRSLVEFGWWQPRLGGLEADTEVYGLQCWPGVRRNV